jgi:hypothetical protein
MSAPPRAFSLPFAGCWIVGDPDDANAVHLGFAPGWVETRYPDGTATDARPHLTDHYRLTARRAGYGTTAAALAAYCLEHEIAHTFLAEAQGQPHSPTLYDQAHRPAGYTYSPAEIADWIAPEERVVKAFQRYANTGVVSAALDPLLYASAGDRAAALDPLRAAWVTRITVAFGRLRWWEPLEGNPR